MPFDSFIYGKNETTNVISVEVKDDKAYLICEKAGKSYIEEMENTYWILYHEPIDELCISLSGDLFYKWARKYDNSQDYVRAKMSAEREGIDYYTCYNPKESFLIKSGVTYYMGMTPADVSILSFDLETVGLAHNKQSKILMISNTYRKNGKTERRLFTYDDYGSQKEMINDWCKFVQEVNPSILAGHNIFGFDLPYLKHCYGGDFPLGRDGSKTKFGRYVSKFRKDGSQSYDYKNVLVWGREIIDTFHLAIKYDVARNYVSYGLKQIIKQEGLERQGRQHYDAAMIQKNYTDVFEWDKIKQYAIDDADDALALFDLMIPSYFYYAQSIPKTMQQIINSATGSQVNAFMVRSYLSENHSIPKATEAEYFKGGISFGNPGLYSYVYKVDVASLYPSIIRQYEIYDLNKDPKRHFLRMVKTFTEQRLEHKRLAKETGDRYYHDREQAEKILINSAYGFMGAPGLNFNSPKCAAKVTRIGREILEKGIDWAESKGFKIVNADTDSFSFTQERKSPNGAFNAWLDELNNLYPDLIHWEDDGHFKRVLVIKAKNYVLQKMDDTVIIKGSALKATTKEKALKEFIDEFINLYLSGASIDIRNLYDNYVRRISDIGSKDIDNWVSKKTITKAVLNPGRTNEQRIADAIKASGQKVSEGDKIYVFFKTETQLALKETFDGTYSVKKFLGKLYNTIKIFDSVIDLSLFPNYTLKRNAEQLKRVRRDSSSYHSGIHAAQTSLFETQKGAG